MSYVEVLDEGQIDNLIPHLLAYLASHPDRTALVRQVIVVRSYPRDTEKKRQSYSGKEDQHCISCYSLNSQWKGSSYLVTCLIFEEDVCYVTLVPTELPPTKSFRGWKWRRCYISSKSEPELTDMMRFLSL
jgi:hypothetical protein